MGGREDAGKKGRDAESHQPEMEEAGKQHGPYRAKGIKPQDRKSINRNGFI